MGATEVVISRPSVVSPFRAQLTITGRRLGEVPLIFANTILTVAISILSESVLAFLNLSVRQNISWGRIVAEAQKNNAMTIGNPGWLIIPGLCIVFLVFGFYLFGYALDEILNPRLRRR